MHLVSFKNKYLVIYPSTGNKSGKTIPTLKVNHDLLHGSDNGNIGVSGKRLIKSVIPVWVQSIQYAADLPKSKRLETGNKLAFVTLTLSASQCHTHKEIKRHLLNHFMIKIKRDYGITRWLWKAEVQKNQNIHFHIIIDKFIDYRQLQTDWNKIQAKLGYIDRFEAKFNHRNPPSVEIRKVRNVEEAQIYLNKYITKQNEPIDEFGRCWGCSDNIRSLECFKLEFHSQLGDIFNEAERMGVSEYIPKENFVLISDPTGYIHSRVRQTYRKEYLTWLELSSVKLGLIVNSVRQVAVLTKREIDKLACIEYAALSCRNDKILQSELFAL